MRKTIAAIVTGLAFVTGGFFAGTMTTSDPAVAQVAETPEVDEDVRPVDRRPRLNVLEAAAEELGMEPGELVAALRDGVIPADLTDDVDGLISAIVDAVTAELDQAVTDGRLDPDRADEITASLDERVTEFVNSTHPDIGKRWRPDRHVRGFVRQAADAIGIDASVLAEGLRDGKSIAEVAEDHGVSRDDLVTQLTEAAQTRIEKAIDRTRG